MKVMPKVIEWLCTGVVTLVVLAAFFLMISPRFGWGTHPVLSGSMEPALSVGGVIVTMPIRPEEVRVGDVITFPSGDQLVTHRVVEIVRQDGISSLAFRTKGDANASPDSSPVSVNGTHAAKTVAYLPYLGYLAANLRNPLVFGLMMGAGGLGFMVLVLKDLLRPGPKAKRSA